MRTKSIHAVFVAPVNCKPLKTNISQSFESHSKQFSILKTIQQTAPQIQRQKQVSSNRKSHHLPNKNLKTAGSSGLNDDFLFARKENYLNSCFNARKGKLQLITKENKQIYKRINSQKSFYSSTDLDKSFQSNCQIKRRLQSSKISQRLNSSRNSSKSSKSNRNEVRFGKRKHQPQIEIKASDISRVENEQLKGFRQLFMKHIPKTQKSQKIGLGSFRKTQISLKRIMQPKRSIEVKPSDGGLLHRIAEQMLSRQPEKIGLRKPRMFLRRQFVF